MHPYLTTIQTVKDLGFDQDLSYSCYCKQDNDQFHAFQRSEIKHGLQVRYRTMMFGPAGMELQVKMQKSLERSTSHIKVIHKGH